MENDKLLKILQKNYGRVIYYQSSSSIKNPDEYYFFNIDIWKLPMPLFHLLRKLAIIFDKLANYIRQIIFKYTERKENLEFKSDNRKK